MQRVCFKRLLSNGVRQVEEEIRKRLKQLVDKHGSELCYNSRRLEAFLKDYCGEHKREINLLVMAAREGTARELLNTSGTKLEAWDFQRLVRKLCEDTGMSEDFARWAVESWALALGKELPSEQEKTPVSTQPLVESQLDTSPKRLDSVEETLPPTQSFGKTLGTSATGWRIVKLFSAVILAVWIFLAGSRALIRKAGELGELVRHNEAVQSYTQDFNEGPQDAMPQGKEDSLVDRDRRDEFVNPQGQTSETSSQDASAWHQKGARLTKLGRYEEAIKYYDRALEINPQYALAWYYKGATLARLRRHEEALQCYDQALEINPEYVSAWCYKGFSLARLGHHEEAIQCYDRALEINPQHASSWYNKGVSLAKLGRHDEAIQCYDQVIEINPKIGWAWYGKSLCLIELERYEEAVKCCDRTLEVNPQIDLAWYYKGVSLSKLNRYEEAIRCYDRVLKIKPRYASAWAGKGFNLSKLERHEEAIECYDKALEINPNLDWVWRSKAFSLTKLGRHNEARYCYKQAEKINQKENPN
jgi:tetratricopeptide (TPR) repeat protein